MRKYFETQLIIVKAAKDISVRPSRNICSEKQCFMLV